MQLVGKVGDSTLEIRSIFMLLYFFEGPFMIINVLQDSYSSTDTIKLNEIPNELEFEFTEVKYQLLGLIELVHIHSRRSNIGENDVGHYKTISKRVNGSWYEIDDLSTKAKKVNTGKVFMPPVILYTAQEN